MLDRQFVLNLANQIANFQQRNNGYLARQELERLHSELCHDEKRLEPFGFKVYSQGDEDGIIEEICRRLKMTLGTFFEIGVENGLECNSLYLIHRGWKGCWIERNQNYCDSIQKNASIIPRRLQLFSKTVSVDNINSLIVEAGFDRNISIFYLSTSMEMIFICLSAWNIFQKLSVSNTTQGSLEILLRSRFMTPNGFGKRRIILVRA